jgi:hypothetical protein
MKTKNNIIKLQPYVELRREDINDRAFRLWRAAGRPPGRALSYWLQAEVELISEQMEGRAEEEPLAKAA